MKYGSYRSKYKELNVPKHAVQLTTSSTKTVRVMSQLDSQTTHNRLVLKSKVTKAKHMKKFELTQEQLKRVERLKGNEPEQELVVLPVLLTKGLYDMLLEKVRTLQLVENYGYDEHNLVVSAFESMTLVVLARLQEWKDDLN